MTTRHLLRIAPLRAGQVLGTFWGAVTICAIPLLLLRVVPPPPELEGNPGALLILPLLNALGGFLVGAVGAAIYNLTARITGGLEYEVADEPEPPQQFGGDR